MVPFGLGALLADLPEGGEEIRLAMIELPTAARPDAIPLTLRIAGWRSPLQVSADPCESMRTAADPCGSLRIPVDPCGTRTPALLPARRSPSRSYHQRQLWQYW